MARLPRLVIPQQLHHVFQRGSDGRLIFQDQEDYLQFLRWLGEAAQLFQVKIHGYLLMPDHWQLLLTPADALGLGKMMQWLGRKYVPYFNRKNGRQGALWASRFKATVLEANRYLLPTMLYMEAKPVELGLAVDAFEYPWSSFAHHAGGKLDPLVFDHAVYWALGNTPFQREAAYKELMRQGLSEADKQAIMRATQRSWLLGSVEFQMEMTKLTDRRVMPAKRGRPVKSLEIKE